MKKVSLTALGLTALLALGMFGCMPPQNVGEADAPSQQSAQEAQMVEEAAENAVPVEATEEEQQRQEEELRADAIANGLVPLNAGESATSDTGLTFSLSEGAWEAQVPSLSAEEGTEFFVVEGTIENTSDAPINLSEKVVATVSFGNGNAADGIVLLPDAAGAATLQPGASSTLQIAAALPAELKGSTETPTVSLEIRATEDTNTVANVYEVTLG